MAVKKLPSGSYQARLPGKDGRMLTKTFASRLEAEEQVVEWKRWKKQRKLETLDQSRMSLDAYFDRWFRAVVANGSASGWRKNQLQLYRDFISPVIGHLRLLDISPRSVQSVLTNMAEKGKAAQTQLHAFGLLSKLFSDAIEIDEMRLTNPALSKLRPKLVVKEAPHLNHEQALKLIRYVEDQRYGTAIWLQLYMGLRLGEAQGLRWQDVDLVTGRIFVRRVYVRKTRLFRDYPKSGKQRVLEMPPELWKRLEGQRQGATSELVTPSPSPEGHVLPYRWYRAALKKYCEVLGLPAIGTHGLRHSSSELYLRHGATQDDVRQLLGHSSSSTTQRYLHGRNGRLDEIAKVLRLFPHEVNMKSEHETESLAHRFSN